MKLVRVPLAKLKVAPYNPRRISKAAIAGLAASMREFGVVEPIVWNRQTGHVVGGHQRLAVLRSRKEKDADVVVVDLPIEKEKALNLALNNPGLQGEFTEGVEKMILDLERTLPELVDELRLEEIKIGGEKEAEEVASETGEDDGKPEFPIYPRERLVDEAFKFYRARGFPFPQLALHVQMQQLNQLSLVDQETAKRTNAGGRVADTWHGHRFKVLSSNSGHRSPFDSFNNDKYLRRALNFESQHMNLGEGMFGAMNLVSSTYAAMNFRPGYAMHLYRRFAPKGGLILDPCHGFGGRLVGWMASRLPGRYVGVDPATETHKANVAMAKALGFETRTEFHRVPFEEFDIRPIRGKVDFAFTSPPYFTKEHYSDEDTQTWKRYAVYDSWVSGFLRPFSQRVAQALKPGAFACVNIADVEIGKNLYPLEKSTVEEAKAAGLELVETLVYQLSDRPGQAQQDNNGEPVFVFRKGGKS